MASTVRSPAVALRNLQALQPLPMQRAGVIKEEQLPSPFAQGLSSTNINQCGYAHRQTKTHSAHAQSILKAMFTGFINSAVT